MGTVCLAHFWTKKQQYQKCMLMGHFKYHRQLLEITCVHLLDVIVCLSKSQNQRTFPRYGCSIDKFFSSPILDFKSASYIQFPL